MHNKRHACHKNGCHCHHGTHSRLWHFIKSFSDGLTEFYYAPYRSMLAREYRDKTDFFMMMVFSESLGIPNPMEFYTLELQPFLLEAFHDWHTRMGIEKSPLEHFGCC